MHENVLWIFISVLYHFKVLVLQFIVAEGESPFFITHDDFIL